MSSLLNEMWDSSEEIESIFQEYILTKDNGGKALVYCFFEGKDDYKYYGSRIKAYTEKETIPFNCKGKDNVLTLHAMIKDNTCDSVENNLLFFIDRDFDKEENEFEEIYVTPCYAIENFYITDTAFCEFLKGELNINKSLLKDDEDKIDYEIALEHFRKERTKFINNTVTLNVWYALQKNKSTKVLTGHKPNLSQIKSAFSKKLSFPIKVDELKTLTPHYLELTDIEMKEEENRLLRNPLRLFRGKYYEEFLYKVLDVLITDSNRPKLFFSKKRKVNLVIGKDNLISNLSQYADTPTCLKDYLRSRLIITENTTESRIM
ncbi:DUF4435 domain-containing protein [Priestia megaterium]|uniref:DUF4435 domain-containing protein n=1 Tax=Priestia megaterium TaxID=1404 RepID=UPI0024535AC5|nr:DUF4435 domain-containing protein [Priestia megaterium]MDH3180940.1 DUF4435 domain-containing protein [Priestia megaterium]